VADSLIIFNVDVARSDTESVACRLHGRERDRRASRHRRRDRSWDPDREPRAVRRSRFMAHRHRSPDHSSPRSPRTDLRGAFDAVAPHTPARDLQLARVSDPILSDLQIGSMTVMDYYDRFAASKGLVGDHITQSRSIRRLEALGFTQCQVLVNTTDEELIMAWNIPVQVEDDLGGPGFARSFVFQFRNLIIQHMHQSSQILHRHDAGSPALAGAIESSASATQRLKRKRRPYDRDLESSEDEAGFDLGKILDSYRSKQGSLRRVPSSAFGDLRRLQQLSIKCDRRTDTRVPFLAHSSI
jgi:hypothetical protein